jgi:ribosomal protein S12 methylthiotransferase
LNKINFISLGCAKNLVDSEKVIGILARAGCTLVTHPSGADTVVLNTCGFILPALEETECEIRRLLRLSRQPRIYVFGCGVNRAGKELKEKFPRVQGWFKISERDNLIRAITGRVPKTKSRFVSTGVYAYLKIAEGCSNHCSYCTIPSIRGELRSYEMPGLVREAEELVKLGVREIILVAQDTAAYGSDLYGRPRLAALIRELSLIKKLSWIRVLYAHPKSLDKAMIAEIAENPKTCKYIDLPIQHIADRILKLMNRGIDRAGVEGLLEKMKSAKITIRTTVIAGFPTETDAEHAELVEFIRDQGIDWLGVFPYYRELGTRAARLPPVPAAVVRTRYQNLFRLQKELLGINNRTRIGRSLKVLVTGRNDRYIGHAGFTAPDIDSRIIISQTDLKIGKFYLARILGRKGRDLLAKVENRSGRVKNA